MNERECIDHLGDKRRRGTVTSVESEHRIGNWIVAVVHFLGERFLEQVHHRGTNVEIFTDLVVQVGTQHRLALHADKILALCRDGDWCT